MTAEHYLMSLQIVNESEGGIEISEEFLRENGKLLILHVAVKPLNFHSKAHSSILCISRVFF